MANNPTGKPGLGVNFLPDFYQTPANKKFLQATIDQLYQPGTVSKVSGFIGRENAKAATGADVYVTAADTARQNYQLEPGLVIKDSIGNVTFFKDYIDYINQIGVFGGITNNHARLNQQEFYSWDPHIDWDKFVNFQNYYWLPYGPDTITIYGQAVSITSTYTVKIQSEGNTNEYLFTPNGLDLNPVLKLYRGQTYTFEINSPGNPFSFMSQRVAGASTRYKHGVSNFAIEQGTITFTVPLDAPSILYYQSETDINLGGALEIFSVTDASTVDVEKDILGKKNYTLADGTALSNGMKISFGGTVIPFTYATGQYYVEGVGTAITLIDSKVLEIVNPYTVAESIAFDSAAFDVDPFSDATGFASITDYLVINRASKDHNPWSRYNRWFHKDVIATSASYNGSDLSLDQTARAIRPIIEFQADLKLFNFGTTAIDDIDLVDTFTTDIFSTIEGSRGYNIDGVPLISGHRVLFLSDNDPLVQNKIYTVSFINIKGYDQIVLTETGSPVENQTVLVKQGIKNQSRMYWFNGTSWQSSQQKNNTNQAPLFDVVDDNGISFGDTTVYNGTSFTGTSIFSYKIGTGTDDLTLGFPLSYQNVNNIGDIVFNFTLATDSFQYKETTSLISKNINVGYLVRHDYSGNPVYVNGWKTSTVTNTQAAIRIYKNSNLTNNFNIDIFDDIAALDDLVVRVYVNGIRLSGDNWGIVNTPMYKQVVLKTAISLSDVLTIKAFSAQPINSNGYYEIPLNLQNNPLNAEMQDFTLGEVIDHVNSIVDNLSTVFVGNFPGDNNLRDLGSISQYGTKFIQHSGPASLSIYHITSQSNNIIKALETSRDDYNNFKRNFITAANNLGIDGDPVALVDRIMLKLNANTPNTAPYYFSDMVPYGASIKTDLTVVDHRIKMYPLSSVFTLSNLSNKAVGIYLNGIQLIYGQDYTFDDQGLVVIDNSVVMHDGDTITTVEYDSTDGSFVPATPTKLGFYPKFVPKIYTDTTLVTPRTMIQGHDGSLILAYGDYRDNLILELEKRIFNNIKVNYDTSIFDITDTIPGYNRKTAYSLSEFNQILAPNFYRWVGKLGVDFSKPLNYDRANSFTYNYTGSVTPDGQPTPGYWRGIYRWVLDTDRPNICPWEMLGFTIQPTWWVSTYGPAPYTSNNLIMWQDIANGLVRGDGTVPAYTLSKYAKPFLMSHLPVDENGNLVSPTFSGLAKGPITQSTDNNFIFGDESPVETAWRRSSHYPFSIVIAAMLATPAKTFGLLLDRSRIVRNLAGQLVFKDTGLRITPADVLIPSIYSSKTRVQTAGIVNYVVDLILNYIFSNNLTDYNRYASDLKLILPGLSYRVGAFTNKDQFNLLLESKTPLSTGSVFIPSENYNIILNSSSPVKKLTYSGVIITKVSTGFEVKGYSITQPYFYSYQYTQTANLVNVGGISENYSIWTPGQQYAIDTIVQYSGAFYRATKTFTAGSTFVASDLALLTALPVVGGASAYFRKSWDRTTPTVVPYGTLFTTIQDVVDFLTGYGEYLKDQGFLFDDFNTNLGVVLNWETSAKEFMFWTTQNWSVSQDKWSDWTPNTPINYGTIVRYDGVYYSALYNLPVSDVFDSTKYNKLDGLSNVGNSVISLSPGATGLSFTTDLTVIDDISNSFNNYEIFKADGTPIPPRELDSYREGNTATYSPRTTDGIFCASFYLIQNEHVAIIDNSTIFNDIIYNPPSGYRRERVKASAYVTNGWYGGLDIPGFIYDRAEIQSWQAWQDYNMGEVISFQGYYYSADKFIAGTATFISTDWVQLNSKPMAQILPNWTNIATQFTDFYSLEVDSFDSAQQSMGQHLIGYQKRQYLENIIQDDVSEFKFYQGMIREKGTQNVLNKLFNVLSSDNLESLTFYEEWALRVGQYGASHSFENIELVLDEGTFKNNPQALVLTNTVSSDISNFVIQQTPNDVYLKPNGYDSAPFPITENYQPLLRSAGYVNPNDVFITLKNISDIVTQDITTFNNGAYIWCTFDNKPNDWNIYRFTDLGIRISAASYDSNVLTLTTETIPKLKIGDYVGLSQVPSVNGFYQVTGVGVNSFTISATLSNFPSPANSSNADYVTLISTLVVYSLTSQRTTSIDNIDSLLPLHFDSNELIWTDDRGDGKWATWKYVPCYKSTAIANLTPFDNALYGSLIAVNSQGTAMAIRTSTGNVIMHARAGVNSPWVQTGKLDVPFFSNRLQPSASATVIALSPDASWLVTGSPTASDVSSNYLGSWVSQTYLQGSIVGHSNLYWKAVLPVPTGTEPSTVNSVYWEEMPYIPVSQPKFSTTTVSATSLVAGQTYQIANLGPTDFTLFGAASNTVGQSFIANSQGTGTGTAAPIVYAGSLITGTQYTIRTTGNSDFITVGAFSNAVGTVFTASGPGTGSGSVFGPAVTAGSFNTNQSYVIQTLGTLTDFTQVGAASNTVDTIFVATGPGTGTGLALLRTVTASSGLSQQGVISIYQKDLDNNYNLIDTITSPSPAAGELFGSALAFGVDALYVGSPGTNQVYKFSYTSTTVTSAIYNPIGSGKGTLVLSSTLGIFPGMHVKGTGFTKGQTVETVLNNTTLLLTGTSDGVPDGLLSFYTTGWGYDVSTSIIGPNGTNFGNQIVVSNDGLTVLISATAGSQTGKVYVYKQIANSLTQTQVLPTTNTLDNNADNNYGNSIAISNSGEYIAIADQSADTTAITQQGFVRVYVNTATGYSLYQELQDHQPTQGSKFGNKIAFMNDYTTLVVYSQDGDTYTTTTIDEGTTTFDKQSTNFRTINISSGRIDVYDQYSSKWVFAESLSNPTSYQGFGQGFAVGNNHIVAGVPYAYDQGFQSGNIFDFYKTPNKYTWTLDRTQTDIPNLDKIKKVFLYDKSIGELVTYLDIIDPLQGKIAGIAEEELRYKAFYDPSTYSVGTSSVNVDPTTFWSSAQVGQLWWDLRTAKFLETYFNDPAYRNNVWNTVAPGASIDIYEWVSSPYLPSVWDSYYDYTKKTDTPAGLALGISGTSLYGDSVYSVYARYDSLTKTYINTYYFWVKNKQTVPNISGRNISAASVANLISNPRGQGYSYISFTANNSISLTNVKPLLSSTNTVLSIEYWLIDNTDQNVHSQWKLISNDTIVDLPHTIEQKWFDSLCGVDQKGRVVPDPSLPPKLRYGIENRPRQSMFVNRVEALKEFIETVNSVMSSVQITESRDLTALESHDPIPTAISGLWDTTILTEAGIDAVAIGSFTRPVLTPIITNGTITGITIVNSGKGYINAPYITIAGSGDGAVVQAVIDSLGHIIGATVITGGEGYDENTVALVRDYCVLVQSDSQADNTWSIYSYDPVNKLWSRILTQRYDVRKYWSYIDWYQTGYSQFTSPDFAISTFADLNSISAEIGETVKVLTANSGKWILLEKVSNSSSVDWTASYSVVGLQEGTIQLSSALYNFKGTSVGYDASTFDEISFDTVAATELRTILNAIKNNIFIDDLKLSYLDLFFSTVRYAYSEQLYLDWIFKTSFVRATHNVGQLSQPVNYPVDNLSNFQDYVSEVKPYRTKVREYISKFSGVPGTTGVEMGSTAVTDFDLQSTYENNKLTTLCPTVSNGVVHYTDSTLTEYPWKFWLDNVGFEVTEIHLTSGGSGYINIPQVIISSSSGSGATAKAYIANGVVNRIVLITNGRGYLTTPTVTFSGGLSVGGTPATAVVYIGNSVVRSSLISLKFDRLTSSYYMNSLNKTQTFTTTTSSQLQFTLQWAPDIRVGKSSVTINGAPILREFYTISLVSSKVSGQTVYSGKLTLSTAPKKNSVIVINYSVDTTFLTSVDRIQFYYNPTSGQLGKDLSQLMTGVDYGGAVVSGLDFNVSGGWDSSAFYTDKWDAFDPSYTDYTIQVAANTHTFTLPYNPTVGTLLNVYYVQNYIKSYTADGTTSSYSFNPKISFPVATVELFKQTQAITSTYTAASSVNTYLTVASTVGIVPGMIISGTGFSNRQQVIRVLSSTTLTISSPPIGTVPDGTVLTFSNLAGSFILSLADTTGLRIGDSVSTAVNSFGYNAEIVSIDSVNHNVTLNQILYTNIANATSITFTRTLIQPVDVTINANGTIVLTQSALADTPSGSTVAITGTLAPQRLDDPNYGTLQQTNSSAIMQTINVGTTGTPTVTTVNNTDGTTSTVIAIPNSFVVSNNDSFILRQQTSDGSINSQLVDYDTAITGGDLAYSTATGLAADDIVLDGDGLVTPTTSPATEEVVPGQVVDALAVKVYDKPSTGSASIKVDNYISDGITYQYSISQQPNSPTAVIVKIGSTIMNYTTDNTTDYRVDYKNRLIKFSSAPTADQTISIFSIGFSGANILDTNYFVGDGTSREFITTAPWTTPVTFLAYVDGQPVNPTLFKTDSTYEYSNTIGLRFAGAPAAGSLVNYIIVSGANQSFAITKSEKIATNGSLTYTLQNPVGNQLPDESFMLVRVDQNILYGPVNSYYTIQNQELNYTIDSYKVTPFTVSIDSILVYADGNKLTVGKDYTIDLSGITVSINQAIYGKYLGKQLTVSVQATDGYSYDPNTQQITFTQAYNNTHTVEVISSYVHDFLDMQRTEIEFNSSYSITPGTPAFYAFNRLTSGSLPLDRPVLNSNYVWVIKNNTLLTPSVDYQLSADLQSVQLTVAPSLTDKITLITFGSNVLPQTGASYMQFKDMLNRVSYKRLNANTRTMLAADLKWNDTQIVVVDASKFDLPNPSQNKPGIVEIRGERIEYFALNGNVLSQLRRGTLGTGIYSLNRSGTAVQNIGPSETIPYVDTATTYTIKSDGTNTVNLNFVPKSVNEIEVFVGGYNDTAIWSANTSYSIGDIVTVNSYTYKCTTAHVSSSTFTLDSANWHFFVGNIRLKKSAYGVFNINNAPYSPNGDVSFPADFTVDGTSSSITLTNNLAVGTQITVVKTTGELWDGYDLNLLNQNIRAGDTTSNILQDSSTIAKFIKAVPGIWYTDYSR